MFRERRIYVQGEEDLCSGRGFDIEGEGSISEIF